MTISELYKQVAQLGFEDSLEDEDRFFYAANRALLQVNKIRPAISYYLINHKPINNLVEEDTFTPVEKETELTFEATNAKSFYFEADGNGVVYIEKFNQDLNEWSIIGSVEFSSTKAFVAHKGFIKDGTEFVDGLVRLRFSGQYLYSVKNVALYEFLYSDKEDDIPALEAYTRYDLNKYVEDFLCFSIPPVLEGEKNCILNQDYEIEGNSTILIPRDKKGVYKILYERRPEKIEDEQGAVDSEKEVDLDEELSSLMPILVAGYVWCDDEPTKAEYYMNLYRERVADIESRTTSNKSVTIKSVNGW